MYCKHTETKSAFLKLAPSYYRNQLPFYRNISFVDNTVFLITNIEGYASQPIKIHDFTQSDGSNTKEGC